MFVEAPCEIKVPIKDTVAMEKDSVTFILELTKPRKVNWQKGGQEVTVSEKFKIEVDDTGMRHTLTIYNVTLEENTEFNVLIDDLTYGIQTCSAQLTVTGM